MATLKDTSNFLNNLRLAQSQQFGGTNLTNMYRKDTQGISTEKGTTNPLVFRDNMSYEKTGLQKITLKNKDGEVKDLFLIVPQTKSKTYGAIYPDEMNFAGAFENASREAREKGKNDVADNIDVFTNITAAPLSPVLGVGTAGIAPLISLNEGFNGRLPETPASGGVSSNGGTGTIYGIIDDKGNKLSANDSLKYIQKLVNDGGYTLSSFEKPTVEKKKNGYIPGDLLLRLFGLKRNNRWTETSFKPAENHEEYQTFINNLRKTRN